MRIHSFPEDEQLYTDTDSSGENGKPDMTDNGLGRADWYDPRVNLNGEHSLYYAYRFLV